VDSGWRKGEILIEEDGRWETGWAGRRLGGKAEGDEQGGQAERLDFRSGVPITDYQLPIANHE
jgi:hypothetical protein